MGQPLAQPIEGQPFGARFDFIGRIGTGAMGTVWRARDRMLERHVAIKLLATGADEHAALAEARIAARLQHPNVAAVYDIGVLPSGQHWLAMREIEGQDFAALLTAADRRPDPDTLRRLLGLLHTICAAVAYVHAQGVVHLDIKPANIRVGDYGDVVLLDWGIAGEVGHAATGAGTRRYMPPEQQAGAVIDARMDVYALGRLLTDVLRGRRTAEVGPLDTLAERATATDPGDRPAQASALAAAIERWLHGADAREAAQALIAEAKAMRPEIKRLRAEARRLAAEAGAELDALPSHAPTADKASAWAKEDAAKAARRAAQIKDLAYASRLDEARRRADDVDEARRLQAELHRERVVEAELKHDPEQAERSLAQLAETDTDRVHAGFLTGTGSLTLLTDPPGAEVWCAPYEERGRRLEPGLETLLGCTPLVACPLGRGSWRLRLVRPGHVDVIYPVLMPRAGHWTGIPPGEPEPLPIDLPVIGALGPDERYVPAGLFWSGGDPLAIDSLPRRRIWVDGFVMTRDPLTYRALLSDLEALLQAGESEQAKRIAPHANSLPFLRVEHDAAGFRVEPTDPQVPVLDWPVVEISWLAARAWASWRQEATGHPWRLPHGLEREKAARGADARFWPWGHHTEPTWTNVVDSRAGPPRPCAVHALTADESPYGVRGMAGNVRDWCIEGYRRRGLPPDVRRLVVVPDAPPADYQICRGGAWASKGPLCRMAARFAGPPGRHAGQVGVRLVRPWPTVRGTTSTTVEADTVRKIASHVAGIAQLHAHRATLVRDREVGDALTANSKASGRHQVIADLFALASDIDGLETWLRRARALVGDNRMAQATIDAAIGMLTGADGANLDGP